MARPHTVNRMALIVLMLFLFTAGALQAATLVNENFAYTTGQLTNASGGANVSGGNWTNLAGAGHYIPVISGSLPYTDYPASGVGNMIKLISPTDSSVAEDIKRDFAPQTTGTVYAAFLINLTNLTGLAADTSSAGDYFFGLLPSASVSAVSRICVRKSVTSGNYQLGLRASSGNASVAWNAADLTPGTTHLVTVKWVIVSGAGNDSCLLWIDPALAITEPTPQTIQVAASDPSNVGRVAFYQHGLTLACTPNANIDGVMVATKWANLTPFSQPAVYSTSPANNESGVVTYATVTATFDRAMNAATVDTTSFTLAGVKQAKYYADSIRPLSGGTSFVFYVKDSLRKSDTVTAKLDSTIADPSGKPLETQYSWRFFTVLPETIRPYVVSNIPLNGTTRVAVTDPISVTFSEPLRPSSVDTHSIWLESNRAPRYRLSAPTLSNGNATVTVHLADTLFYHDTVTVHITAGVTDVQSNAVRDTSFTFYTKQRPGLTIYDIQYTTDPYGVSPYNLQTVTFSGVVTSGTENAAGNYFIQDGPGPWNGIYVYDKTHGAVIGDSVRITGLVTEYPAGAATYGMTEITTVTEYTVFKQNCPTPAPIVLTTGTAAGEQYESVMVEVRNVVVDSVQNSYGEWRINDGSGTRRVGNMAGLAAIRYAPKLGDSLSLVRGPLYYIAGNYELQPRKVGDVVNKYPPRVYSSVPANSDNSVPTAVTIGLNFSQPMDPATLIPTNFSLTEAHHGSVPFTVAYDSTKWTCFLVPSRYFTSLETVSVKVSHLVADIMGRTLDGNKNGISQPDSSDDYNFHFSMIGNLLTIAEVQKPDTGGYNSAMVGRTVTIQGALTGPAQYFSSSSWTSSASMYIQDNTSGANIFASSITMGDARIGPQSALGQLMVVTGTVTEYSGVTEITTDTAHMRFWGPSPQLPKIDTMVYNQFMTEDMEGKLALVSGTVSSPPSYAGGGYNMEIRNGDAALAVRFAETAGFDINSLPIGTKVQIIGVVSQYDKYPPYDAGYQIVPRFNAPYAYKGVNYPADISITVDTVAALASPQIVSYTPNPFSPDLGEVVTINVNGPTTDHLTLTLYDLKGRLVRTLLNNVPGGHQVCVWDGKDDFHRPANIGMYIMHLRSVSARGNVVDKNKIIVLGTPLK